jgi:hypothetical protein
VVTIRRLDPHDDAEFAAFHAAYAAANDFERPYAETWPLAEFVVPFRRESVDADHYGLIAQDGDDVVGVAVIELPLTDNRELGDVCVYVPPQHRRRGVGHSLARQIAVDLRQRGRSSWLCLVSGRRYDQSADMVTPGEAFAAHFGLTMRQREVQRKLSLPAPTERLDALARDAALRHGDYRLERWVNRCPDEYVEAYCALKTAMVDEMPTGDIEIETEQWDAERLRDVEESFLAQDRTRYVYVAVAPDGRIAAHTELIVPKHDRDVGHAGAAGASRSSARARAEGREPRMGPGRAPGAQGRPHLERGVQHSDDCRQRGDGVRAGRVRRHLAGSGPRCLTHSGANHQLSGTIRPLARSAPDNSELAQPDPADRVVGVLTEYEGGPAPGGLDVLGQVGSVDAVPQ